MNDSPKRSAIDTVDEPILTKLFAPDAFGPINVNMDDIVTVTMNPCFELVSVTLHGVPDSHAHKLEKAIIRAVNSAVRDVAMRHADKLAELMPR